MKTSILSLALGIVLASPVSAYAAERVYAPALSHQIVDYLGVGPHADPFAAPKLPAARGAGNLTLRADEPQYRLLQHVRLRGRWRRLREAGGGERT